jgi:LPXTG-motif cell wall-anchored protein
VVIKDKNGNGVCVATVNLDGTFTGVPASPITKAQELDVTVIANGPPAPETDLSDGTVIHGRIPGYNPAVDGPLAVVIKDKNGNGVLVAQVNPDGTFTGVPVSPITKAQELDVTVIDEAGNTSSGVAQVVPGVDPPAPLPAPTDGNVLTGMGEPGDTITIRDKTGNLIGSTVVGPDGSWVVTPVTPVPEGTVVTVTQTNSQGRSTSVDWRVGLPKVTLNKTVCVIGELVHVTGELFQTNEPVLAEQHSDPYKIGEQNADQNGKVEWTYKVPEGTPPGDHYIVLTGLLSGQPSVCCTVVAPDEQDVPGLPKTGSNTIGLFGVGLAVVVAGVLVRGGSRRRG